MPDILLLVLTLCLVGQLSPGPDMLLLVRHSAGRSLRYPLACILGIGLGLAVHLALAVLGLAWVLNSQPAVIQFVQYCGAAYLIYLGLKAWQANRVSDLPSEHARHLASGWHCLRDGLLCNLFNPKVTLFMLSLFTQIITPDTLLPEKLLIASAILVEAMLVWVLFVVGLNLPAVKAFFSRHLYRVNQLAGILFVGLGSGLLWAA